MAYNEKTKNSIMKYLAANTDDIRLRVPKGTKESWKKYANMQGISMTRFVLETVNEAILSSDDGFQENKNKKNKKSQ